MRQRASPFSDRAAGAQPQRDTGDARQPRHRARRPRGGGRHDRTPPSPASPEATPRNAREHVRGRARRRRAGGGPGGRARGAPAERAATRDVAKLRGTKRVRERKDGVGAPTVSVVEPKSDSYNALSYLLSFFKRA